MTYTPLLQCNSTLIFLHIQKCAGNSFIDILDGFFKEKEMLKAHLLHPAAPEILRPIPTYRAIIGHNTWDDIMALAPLNPIFMTVLREPLARVLSLYHFWRSHRWEHIEKFNLQGPRLAKTLPLDEFIESPALEAKLNICNSQAGQLLNGLRISPDLDEESFYQIASQRLRQCHFIGLTERFEESSQLLCHTFGWKHPQTLPQENISQQNAQTDPRYEPISKTILTGKVKNRLEQLNRVDIKLYTYAEKIFAERKNRMAQEVDPQIPLKSPHLTYRLKKLWRIHKKK